MISPRFRFVLVGSFFLLTFGCVKKTFAQTTGGPRMYGDISIVSDYVEKGLTQSDHQPALHAGMGYWFGPQGRIGFWASNVKYDSDDATVRMQGFAEYKFVFTPNSDLKIRNDFIRYFGSGQRDNILLSLDQNFFGYHVLFERDDNFEGTKTDRNWFGFQKDWPMWGVYQLNVIAGYSMVEVDGLNNFFDTRVGLSYNTSNINLGIFHTYNSQESQFGDQGKMAFLLSFIAKF